MVLISKSKAINFKCNEQSQRFNIRYGSNIKIVLAIVLPCLLIVPFVFLMQYFKPMEEWLVWLIVFAFLIAVALLSVLMAVRLYPKALLSINEQEISLTFESGMFLTPKDFSFIPSDICSFTRHELRGDEYYRFRTQNPTRRFQVSSLSYSIEDLSLFSEAMAEVGKLVQQKSAVDPYK